MYPLIPCIQEVCSRALIMLLCRENGLFKMVVHCLVSANFSRKGKKWQNCSCDFFQFRMTAATMGHACDWFKLCCSLRTVKCILQKPESSFRGAVHSCKSLVNAWIPSVCVLFSCCSTCASIWLIIANAKQGPVLIWPPDVISSRMSCSNGILRCHTPQWGSLLPYPFCPSKVEWPLSIWTRLLHFNELFA